MMFATTRLTRLIVLLILPVSVLPDVYMKPKSAFVFGGNGQIGAEVVKMLLRDDYNVTILNRGSNYFNSKQDIQTRVNFMECDRFKGLKSYCPQFLAYINQNNHVDVVVDTNAFQTKYMRHSTELFRAINVGVYIFISPDSIYDVCIKRHHGPTKETDSERPVDKAEYKIYATVDEYAHNKLKAEETLIKSGLNYLIFRAPDVLGAKDTSSKFWIYHMWIKYFDILDTPIHLPFEIKQLVSSYVYLEDLIQAVKRGIDKGVTNEVFNVAFNEPITLTTLLLEVSKLLQSEISFNNEITTADSYHLYPSSARGQLDISKAKSLLGFRPTPFKKAIEKTVSFYESAQSKKQFSDERSKVMTELGNNVATDRTKSKFFGMVVAEAISFSNRIPVKDEL